MFPPLPGLTLEYTMRPTFSTIIQTAADRSTARIGLDPFPLWEYDLAFGYISDDPAFNVQDAIRNPKAQTQLEQILGLFLACGGSRDTFLMDLSALTHKATDNTATAVTIGTGDGTTMQFQLYRPIGGFLDFVDNPIPGSVSLWSLPPGGGASVSLVIQSVTNGLAVIKSPDSQPPANGAAVQSTFSFLQRLRFVNDAEDFDSIAYRLLTHGKLKLKQERNLP